MTEPERIAELLREAVTVLDEVYHREAVAQTLREAADLLTAREDVPFLPEQIAQMALALHATQRDSQLIADILAEYRDDLTKASCDECEQCGNLVMCSFHSVLSLLSRDTWTTAAIKRSNERRHRAASIPAQSHAEPKNGDAVARSADIAAKHAAEAKRYEDAADLLTAQAAQLAQVQSELDRVQRLPELPWAEVCASLMQRFAMTARHGSQGDAKAMLEVLDKGKTYVTRLEARVEAAEQLLAQAKREVIEAGGEAEAEKLRRIAAEESVNGCTQRVVELVAKLRQSQDEAQENWQSVKRAHVLLKRLYDLPHMATSLDGPYWRQEIANTVAPLSEVTNDDIEWARQTNKGEVP